MIVALNVYNLGISISHTAVRLFEMRVFATLLTVKFLNKYCQHYNVHVAIYLFHLYMIEISPYERQSSYVFLNVFPLDFI